MLSVLTLLLTDIVQLYMPLK